MLFLNHSKYCDEICWVYGTSPLWKLQSWWKMFYNNWDNEFFLRDCVLLAHLVQPYILLTENFLPRPSDIMNNFAQSFSTQCLKKVSQIFLAVTRASILRGLAIKRCQLCWISIYQACCGFSWQFGMSAMEVLYNKLKPGMKANGQYYWDTLLPEKC